MHDEFAFQTGISTILCHLDGFITVIARHRLLPPNNTACCHRIPPLSIYLANVDPQDPSNRRVQDIFNFVMVKTAQSDRIAK
jgi:hypothetical protein